MARSVPVPDVARAIDRYPSSPEAFVSHPLVPAPAPAPRAPLGFPRRETNPRLPFATCLALLLTLCSAACAPPDRAAPGARRPDLTFGSPEEVGLSADGIAKIGPAMQAIVDAGQTAGVMTLVARDGKVVHWDAAGWRVLGDEPLQRTDVFRIYSMTKPVTSVAVMMLVEEGLIGLDEPLATYLPAFADVEVWDDGVLRRPTRAITIRDLLRHTSGLTYGVFADTPVDRMYVEALDGLSPFSGRTLGETVEIIASLPLVADPGTRWNYSMSTDVLGRVVEVASGTSLEEFFRTRIFAPLGMTDTGFHVAPRNADRLVSLYRLTPDGLAGGSAYQGDFTRSPTWLSGGGGLTSTAMDYLRFAQMLLQEGELDGARILRPETVHDMTRDQLGDLGPISLAPTDGFGLGFAVSVTGPTPGIYWWVGVVNTWFWIDPVERIVAFAWTQLDPLGAGRVNPLMRRLVYEAVADSRRGVPAGVP